MKDMEEAYSKENGKAFEYVKNVEEVEAYPLADKQFASNRKYMTYESISTGVGGKK
jgi:hypothetical protein